jgi:hypothetical protein
MSATIVFVHGRGQEGKDPAELQRSWRAGLAAGLVKAGAPPVDAVASVFPFYGDLLYRITADLARTGERVELESLPLHPDLPADATAIEVEMLTEMAAAKGRVAVEEEGLSGVLSSRLARRALEFLARRTRLDQEIIKAQVKDVAVYLTKARDAVLDAVRDAVPPGGPIVLVSHSLGTVVARDLLSDAGIRARTRLWVTAGSPLGLDAVQRNLLTKGAVNPGVPWLTCWDVNDVVAIGHPLRPTWKDPLQEFEVENSDAPHSIERYLGHAAVARAVGAAATAG